MPTHSCWVSSVEDRTRDLGEHPTGPLTTAHSQVDARCKIAYILRAKKKITTGRLDLIKDPPLLRIKRDFERPETKLLEGFAGVPTGHLVDAMGGRGCIDYRIKPLAPSDTVMVGVAVTCHAGPADNLALFGAVHAAGKGDILIAATDSFMETAVTGDLLLGMARNRGIAGLVTDGLIRDLVGVLGVGIPVYCAGITANSPARNGPGTVGLPVVIGGVMICSGDIIVGDRDGVVVVPFGEAHGVLARLKDVKAAEAGLEAKVKAGLEIPDFIEAILASDKVEKLS
jgi:4-hydroxy-4-methyl-2-oxoglutarate aldolase